MLVFAEASSFARLNDIDPSGWFYQAVLYNPTDSDIVVTGLRWWYKASLKMVDGSRDVKCYDSRYFSSLPVTNMPNDKNIWWEYAPGTISIIVPAKEIIVTWIEVPTLSVNNEGISATYYVQAYVDGQWLSSPLYDSHSGHDNAVSTIFRADFNLTTDPNNEQQMPHPPEWLFNEDRAVVADLSTKVRLIPVASSRNSLGIDYATITVTLPSGWSYAAGTAYNPYSETITHYSVDGKDRLQWNLDRNIIVYSLNQSMAQNYIEFNVTAPSSPGIYNFTITSIITSLDAKTTTENQYIYVVVKTSPQAIFTYLPTPPITSEDITFNATASDDLDGQIVNYSWDFGDDNITTLIDPIITHIYTSTGTYNVTLTVTDNDGLTDSESKLITVKKHPFAFFTYEPEAPIVNETITFNASDSYDTDGTIVNYIWDFGDGTNATGMIVIHNFKAAGTYNVTLTILDNDGFRGSMSKMVTVYIHDVKIVSVTPSATEVLLGQTVNITVIVKNEGTAVENFSVTLYYNNTAIGTQAVVNLLPNAQTTLTFRWNTTGIEGDSIYKIKAEADVVPGEIDTSDNTYVGGNIKLSSQPINPGDAIGLLPYVKYIIPIGLALMGFLAAGFILKRGTSPEYVGFEFFDEITAKGIPDGYSVMIIGGVGSGKSMLCQQLTYKYLTQGKSCVYVTYDCFPEEVRKNMKNFHWSTSEFEQKGAFKFVDCYSYMAGVTSREEYHTEQPYSLSELSILISAAMGEGEERARSTRVFLDSTAPLFTRLEPAQVIKFLQDRVARIKGCAGIFFFTVGKGTVPSGLMRMLDEIVDCIVEIDIYEEKGKNLRKMRIRKLRGQKFVDAWIYFSINAKKGIVFSVPKDLSKIQSA